MTPESLQRHGLTSGEYERIRELLGRAPNETELGVFGVMWSEHCSYKSSRLLLKTLPTQGPAVLQGPGENAGIIDVGDGWACVFKIESHNHPSFVEPFQGAATGVGGILRDVFTMGARPVAVMDSLRFGPLDEIKNQSIAAGVVAGVGHYGNCFGVPNLGGETQFDPSYSGNPLVNAFALGLARRDALFFGKASGVGNPVMYVGAKTGRDGIHGATMASEEFSASSSAKRPNVQVGDPFLEKLLLEACLEAMATGAVEGIQDMGAAGLTSSSCEMGARAGTGVELDLDQVPQRETGMTAYEMLLSESQERMLLVAKAGREAEVAAVFRKWGLDAVTVGRVTPDGKLRVRHHGAVVAEIPNSALTDAAPRYQRPQRAPARTIPLEAPAALRRPRDLAADLLALLQAPNLASKTWVYEQYDTMVRTNTLLGPGGAAGVIRIKGTETALAMALAGNGRYCRLDPKLGAQHAVAAAARKVACTGAHPLAATNCLNFGNPEKPEVMWQLAQAIAGMGEACRALGTPITGGNVSLYNETLGEGIQPTPIVGVVGRLELRGGQAPLPARFTRAGEPIFLLRPTLRPDARTKAQALGSSEFAASRLGMIWGTPPPLDLTAEHRLHQLLARAAREGVIQMARPVGAGGRAVALAKACVSHSVETGDLPVHGVEVDLPATGDPATALFGEFSSEVVVTSNAGSALQDLANEAGLDAVVLGETRASGFALAVTGQSALRLELGTLAQAWQGGLVRYFNAEAVVA